MPDSHNVQLRFNREDTARRLFVGSRFPGNILEEVKSVTGRAIDCNLCSESESDLGSTIPAIAMDLDYWPFRHEPVFHRQPSDR